jgi:hypothetical protein
MISPLDQVCYASVPAAALAVLADVRCLPDVRVALVGDRAWVRWPAGNDQVLWRLLPVSSVALYSYRNGLWFRFGCHLPSFDLPIAAPSEPLDHVLTPARVEPQFLNVPAIQPHTARLVRDNQPRQTTAMICPLMELGNWAEAATSAALGSIRAAYSGERIMLLGRNLPILASSERFWGQRLLAPLGHRLTPALPEDELLTAFGVHDEELMVFHAETEELIPEGAFEPFSRAGIRLALGARF